MWHIWKKPFDIIHLRPAHGVKTPEPNKSHEGIYTVSLPMKQEKYGGTDEVTRQVEGILPYNW